MNFYCDFQGLSKMGRTHVHFAPGLPKETGVISGMLNKFCLNFPSNRYLYIKGMRSSAQVYIYIDMEKALQGLISNRCFLFN